MNDKEFDAAEKLDVPGFEPPEVRALPNADIEELQTIIRGLQSETVNDYTHRTNLREEIRVRSNRLAEVERRILTKEGVMEYLKGLVEDLEVEAIKKADAEPLLELDELSNAIPQPPIFGGGLGSGCMPDVSPEEKEETT